MIPNCPSEVVRELMDSLPDPVLLLGPHGELLYINAACMDQLGWSQARLESVGLTTLFNGQSLDAILGKPAEWTGVGEDARIVTDSFLRTASGEPRIAELTLSPYRNADGSPPSVYLLQLRCHRTSTARLESYHALFRSAEDSVFMKDRELRYVALNPSMCALYKVEEKAMLGRRAVDFFSPELAESMEEMDHLVLSGERVVRKLEVPDADGVLHIYDVVKTPIYDQTGTISGICCISREITESERMRKSLRGKEEHLRALTDSIPGHVFSYIRGPDGHKHSLHRSSGLDLLLGKRNADRVIRGEAEYVEFIHPQDRADFPAPEVLPAAAGLRLEVEYRLRQEDGSYRWVLMRSSGRKMRDGSVLWNGILLDIDARLKAQEQLRLANQQLLSLADNLPGLIYSYRKQTDGYRKPIFFSFDRFADLIGPAGAARLKQDLNYLAELMHPDDRDRIPKGQSQGEGKPLHFEMEYRLRQDSGAYRWVYSRSYGFEDADGNMLWHGFLLDIDARKRAEESLYLRSLSLEQSLAELDEARREAEEASLAKGRFLASMSHEIRTPLTAVLGFTDILADRLDDPADLEALAVIRTNGDHLLEIIKDILDLAKVEAGHLTVTSVDVDALTELRSVAELMSPHIQTKGLTLELDMPEELSAPLSADATRLRQVLLNLLDNALKFTEQGSITLRATEMDDDPRMLAIDVIDTGIGIRSDEAENIFEVFAQVDEDEVREGIGLGLAISKQLVELMGGSIEFGSITSGGSRFRVLLPMAAPKVVITGSGDEIQAAPARLNARILLAEDNPTNQEIVAAILESAGCSLDRAADGEIAVAMEARARDRGQPYDAILMDIRMPVMDGISATHVLREAGCGLPIIALTAHALDEDRERCLAAGCDAHLGKPIDREALVTTLARFIGVDEQGNCRVVGKAMRQGAI